MRLVRIEAIVSENSSTAYVVYINPERVSVVISLPSPTKSGAITAINIDDNDNATFTATPADEVVRALMGDGG